MWYQMFTMWEFVQGWEGDIWKFSVSFAQFWFEHKTTLKNKVLFFQFYFVMMSGIQLCVFLNKLCYIV